MNPPTVCPHCGTDLHVRKSPRYQGEWMFLCGECLGGGAYGENAVRDFWRGARSANEKNQGLLKGTGHKGIVKFKRYDKPS